MRTMKLIVAFHIFLALMPEQCENFLFTKLKNKMKSILKGKSKSQISEFPSESGLEYPGNDPQLRWQIRELWNKYYRCLEEKYQSLQSHKSVMPEAIMVFEGSSVRFDCKACVSPAQVDKIDDVKWFYGTISPKEMIEVEYGEHNLLSPEDKALHMYNLQQENSGQYICKIGNTVMAPYFLEVVNDSEPILKVWPERSPGAVHAQSPLIMDVLQYKIEVFTNWEPWSPCSKCNLVGKKVRFGICTVRLLKQNGIDKNNGIQEKQNDAGTSNKNGVIKSNKNKAKLNLSDKNKSHYSGNERKIKKHAINMAEKDTHLSHESEYKDVSLQKMERRKPIRKIGSKAKKMLRLFSKGIPCRSTLLQSELESIAEVHERRSEIMIAYCKEPCTGDVIFEVLDEKGKVVEEANNSAGIYSMLQGIPPISPSIGRKIIYEDTNTYKIIIRCPGNLNTDQPVQWQIGNMSLNPILISQQTQGRIYIDEKDHINLKRPQPSDSNTYSCWQGKELAGTVRLVVKKALRLNFNHHIMLFGLVMINGTFLLVCYRLYKGSKKMLAR